MNNNFFLELSTENSEEDEELEEEQDEDYSGKIYNLNMYLHYFWTAPVTYSFLNNNCLHNEPPAPSSFH